jgi:hypothetical protein
MEQTLDALKAAIWSRRPILGDIMQKHGSQNLFEYSIDFMDVNPAPGLDERKGELIGVFEELLSKRLGASVAAKAAQQLRNLALVSTTDHHAVIQHPFFLNANIISALPSMDGHHPDYHHLIVLSFASVSNNNASAYPRGILFHGGVNGTNNLIRLPILPDRLKMSVVYATRPFTREDLTKAEEELVKREQKGEVAKGRGEKLRDVMEEYFGAPDVLNAADFNAQITIINHRLWQRLFHKADCSIEGKIPDLIYLEIETLVVEVLQRFHLHSPTSLLHRLLFDADYRSQAHKHFNNIPGAFSLEKEWGTFFFWGLDDKQHRVRLFLDGNRIRSKEGTISVELTPEAVATALQEKRIYPGMLLCYLMVSLYYGMKCLGGFCQVNDLTMTKRAWRALLTELGNTQEAQAVEPVQTRELSGDGMVLSYMRTVKDEVVPATGFDMALKDKDTTFERYLGLSKRVTMEEIMNPMLPEMYTVLYPQDERQPALTSIHPEDILQATGLDERLARERDFSSAHG